MTRTTEYLHRHTVCLFVIQDDGEPHTVIELHLDLYKFSVVLFRVVAQ